MSVTITFLIWSAPFVTECLPMGREPSSFDHEIVASTSFSGEHWNMADWFTVMVLTAGFTTIPGAEITSPDCPLNDCREVTLDDVGSPGSPFGPFTPGGPGRPGLPGGPTGPWGPFLPLSPGGPWTQIWPFLVQNFCVVRETALVICCCISGAKELLSPWEDLAARGFRFWIEGERASPFKARVPAKTKES